MWAGASVATQRLWLTLLDTLCRGGNDSLGPNSTSFSSPSEAGTLTKNYRRVTSAAGRDTVMDEWPRNGTEMG